jgi:hypothetical protein
MVHYPIKVETHNHPTAILFQEHRQVRAVKSEMKELLAEGPLQKRASVDFGYLIS